MYPSDSPVAREPREIWEIARSQLRLQMTKSTYETWVRDTVCLAYEDGAFVIGVPNAYAKDWLSLRLRPLIKRTLVSIIGHAVEITFVVQPMTSEAVSDRVHGPLLELEQAQEPPSERTSGEGANLNPRYTFENFIVGPSNRMAHAWLCRWQNGLVRRTTRYSSTG